MATKYPMTVEGNKKLKEELDHLKKVERPENVRDIERAREHGDLSENAEYHAQRENQGLVQAKINLLRDKLARASIVDMSKIPKDEIAFGATVVVKDLDFDDEETYTLIGAGEEDYDTGKILVTSPIGQGLVGKKIGDQVEIPVPKGTITYEVVKIDYDFD